MVDDIKNRPLDEIRAAYKKYLNTQNLSQNTVMTSSTDAFYIWRKKGQEAFWQIVLSDNFEVLGKSTLLELLVQQSSGNAEANLSGYMAHLRRFRRFLKTSGIEFSESKQDSSPAVSAVVNSQDPFILQESPYKFDVDKNGLLALTSGNVDRINFIIENDSNYRSDMDPENKESTYNYIRNHPYTRDYEVILGIVERIDIQNSTPKESEAFCSALRSVSIFSFCASICFASTSFLEVRDATLLSFLSNWEVASFISEPSTLNCELMSASAFLNSFSPSTPSLMPKLSAMRPHPFRK